MNPTQEESERIEKLEKANAELVNTLSTVVQNAPGYDWNADPKKLTLLTGIAFSGNYGKGYIHVRELEQTLSILKSTIVWAKETQSHEVESAIRERLEPEVWRLMALKEGK